jgi:hypothetical protein
MTACCICAGSCALIENPATEMHNGVIISRGKIWRLSPRINV